VQLKARNLALKFNEAVQKAPLLKPSEDEVSKPPPIDFLKCNIYEYRNKDQLLCGLLVEKYLSGKFTKYNGNYGYVNNRYIHDGATISLEVGEVKLTDFVQAFSHWVYESSDHEMIVCDLQGILDLEGRLPIFRLTDPAICSKGGKRHNRFGKTDLGMKGIRQFCRHHKCNDVCKGLNLPLMRAK
jgi:myosin-heavy-chain kinase